MSRYTITKEFVGAPTAHYVARFCGDFIGSHRFKCEAVEIMKTHANETRPKITAHRPPTPSEIRFGHGATHYADFDYGNFLRDNGELKIRIKSNCDGLTYSRR
jgi:hypothetical protein